MFISSTSGTCSFSKQLSGVPVVSQLVKNPASIHEDAGVIPGFAQCIGDLALP